MSVRVKGGRSVVALLVAVILAMPLHAAAQPAQASVLQDPQAQEHFQRAQAHFNADEYAQAVPELKAAYALEPNPMLLYAWAQAERLSGNCQKAVPLYEQFIETGPDARQRGYARTNILDCAGAGESTAPPEPTEGPPEDETDTGEEIKPASRDWLGATLVGVGAAAAIVGGVLVGLGQQQVNKSDMAPTEDDHFDEIDAGTTKNTTGIVLLGVGGALIIAGVIRYAVLGAKNRKKRRAEASLLVPRRGFGLRLGVRF